MSLKFKDQFRGKKLYVLIVLLLSFATVSLKIIVMLTACTDLSTCSEKSLKDKILQNSLSNSMIPIRTFSANVAPGETNSKTVGSTGLKRGCEISPASFKSWTRGKVTEVTPVIHANCTLLFKGSDEVETAHVSHAFNTWPATKHALNFTKWMRECHCIHFKHQFEDNFYTAKEEVEFPLAFTMVVHDNISQVFRLLKVLYRPHNIYCIHYDSRSSEDMKLLFKKLAKCFDNIITPSAIIEVEWGRHSLMEAQMNCFRDLLMHHSKYPWRYVITLCGKELPLRTNREIVQLLKRLNGSSAIHVIPLPGDEKPRYEKKWTLNRYTKLVPTNDNAGPIPYKLTIYKSMTYFGLTPEFVNYTLNDEVAITLSRFLYYALIPEEMFYSTLFMIPGVPGGYNANVRSLIPVISSYIWITDPAQMREPQKYCSSGYIVHHICIMTSADLFRMSNDLKVNDSSLKGPMFHNKYFMERDHTVMDCVEEQLVIRNRLEYMTDCKE